MIFVGPNGDIRTQTIQPHSNNVNASSTSLGEKSQEERRHISLNPFKAMTSQSTESTPLVSDSKNASTNRLSEIDIQPYEAVGTLPLDGPLQGVQLRQANDEVHGLAWTEQGITVGLSLRNKNDSCLRISSYLPWMRQFSQAHLLRN